MTPTYPDDPMEQARYMVDVVASVPPDKRQTLLMCTDAFRLGLTARQSQTT